MFGSSFFIAKIPRISIFTTYKCVFFYDCRLFLLSFRTCSAKSGLVREKERGCEQRTGLIGRRCTVSHRRETHTAVRTEAKVRTTATHCCRNNRRHYLRWIRDSLLLRNKASTNEVAVRNVSDAVVSSHSSHSWQNLG